jgi:hypothetical protein
MRVAATVAAFAAALAGCAAVGPKPVAVEVHTVAAPTAVPVPCVAASDIPPRTATAMPEPQADLARKAAGASVDAHNLVAENEQLRALLIQCSSGGKP